MNNDERNQLANDIGNFLHNPNPAPTVPQDPGQNATCEQRAAYQSALHDAEIHGILARPAGETTKEDQDKLRKEILACLKREGL